MDKIELILKEVLSEINVPKDDLEKIKLLLKDFLKNLEKRIKKEGIDVEVFVGGSFAKGTLIKRDYYDIDIFLRFDKKYQDKEISFLTRNIIKDLGKISIVHGSRDYFRLKMADNLLFEIIPVKKIRYPKEANNITDLSYSHVRYIKKKIKNKKILEDIKIAKAFCYANHCYGAESYINGFSGYGLELLVYYYKGFFNFIKNISRANIKEKIIIDIEKQYKGKSQILMDINSAKIKSPIILIDPTYMRRNVLAALSNETFLNFKSICKDFLNNPKKDFFELKRINFEEIKKKANKNNHEFILISIETPKQEGDVAGSKLLKFYNHLSKEIECFFELKNRGFEYYGGKSADFFFVARKKEEVIKKGPFLNQKEHIKRFREKYLKKKGLEIFVQKKNIYVKFKLLFNLKNFIESWKVKNKEKMKEMSIKDLIIKTN